MKIVLEVIAVAVGCAYTVAAYQQLGAMRDQLTEIRNSKADTNRIITASETQAKAATSISGSASQFTASANEMKEQSKIAVGEFKNAAAQSTKNATTTIKDSETFFKDEQRPWAGVNAEIVIKFDATDLNATVQLVNTGLTPALRVQRSIGIVFYPLPLRDEPEKNDTDQMSYWGQTTLAPKATMSLFTNTPDAASEASFHQKLAAAWKSVDDGTDIAYVYGAVRYRDTSDKPHSTQFCFYLHKVDIVLSRSGWIMNTCNGFNGMD